MSFDMRRSKEIGLKERSKSNQERNSRSEDNGIRKEIEYQREINDTHKEI
jgi:hypothetical protein